VNIAANDLKTKANKARDFLKDGHKVKVVLSMRGRELARRDENKRSLFEFIDSLDDVCVPESMPQDERNKTIVYLKRK
jgi:translation initiation factor IF-3